LVPELGGGGDAENIGDVETAMNEALVVLPQGSSVHQEPESLAGTEGAAGKRKADAPQEGRRGG